MSFEREGFFYIAIAALVAAGMYAAALNRRSWALWLLAFALTIVALSVAYLFRDPARRQAVTTPRFESEQLMMPLGMSRGEVPAREIAWHPADRIVTYGKDGEQVQRRLRKELLQFGSRASVGSPLTAAPRLGAGEVMLAESSALPELGQR